MISPPEPLTDAANAPPSDLAAPAVRVAAAATPLWAVLAFTFINSVGGGVVTTGFAFLADSAYGFTARQNYLLGLLQGVLYVVAALTVGPVLARAIARKPVFSTRRTLAALMLVLAALCALPWLGRSLGLGGSWPLWVLIGGYSALTGVLWPIVESYLSGGRSEKRLRSSIGVFNVVWSSALIVSYLAMGPLKQHYSIELLLGVAGLHLACLALLPAFRPNPAAHMHEDHAPAPAVYSRLLSVFRVQLVTSYMVFSALTPFLPDACKSLHIAEHWQTPLSAAWLAARTLTFAVMQRWHRWHGRWDTAVFGAAALLAGFGLAVFSTRLGASAFVAGLVLFGVGMGVIYCAALYYAMSVGNAQVDAGGKHEALIGLGYGGGPVFGLMAIGATGGSNYQFPMLGLVALSACFLIGLSLVRARRHASRML